MTTIKNQTKSSKFPEGGVFFHLRAKLKSVGELERIDWIPLPNHATGVTFVFSKIPEIFEEVPTYGSIQDVVLSAYHKLAKRLKLDTHRGKRK